MRLSKLETPEQIDEAYRKLRPRIRRNIVMVGIVIIMLIAVTTTMVVTTELEYSVIMHMGAIHHTVDNAGLTFKIPFVQDVRKIPKTIQYYDMPVSTITTKDKQLLDMDLFAAYRIINPKLYITTLNGSLEMAETRISNLAYSISKTKASLLSQNELIQGRNDFARSFVDGMQKDLASYGLELCMIETKKIDPLKTNMPAIYDRMRSERERISAQYIAEGEAEAKKIRSDTDRQVRILLSEAERDSAKQIAEGEAEYMQIMSDAYNDPAKAEFYYYIRQLDALKVALKGTDTTLVLNKNSPLARMFYAE